MEFKSIALATTALVALATVASPAQAGEYMGKVNLGLGMAFEDWSDGGESSEDLDLDFTTLHGSASVNIPYSPFVNLQFDIFGDESLDEARADGGEWDGSFFGGFGAGAHLNWRDPTAGALGVFAAVGRANAGWTTDSHFVVFAAGLEGEYYCNNWTLTAQVGFLDSDESGYGLVREAGFIRTGVNFYPSPRVKLAARVGFLAGQTSGSGSASDVEEFNWNFSVEYLFGRSIPVSTYLEVKGQNVEVWSNPTWEFDRTEVRAGVRFFFGGEGDLMKADREGAGMESPDIINWPRFYWGNN